MRETTETWTEYVLSCPWDHPVREVLAALRIAESLGITCPDSFQKAWPHIKALDELSKTAAKEAAFNE